MPRMRESRQIWQRFRVASFSASAFIITTATTVARVLWLSGVNQWDALYLGT